MELKDVIKWRTWILIKIWPLFYNIKIGHDVKPIGIKLIWNNNKIPELNVCNIIITTYVIKGFIINDYYMSDTKLGQDIVGVIRITCSFHSCQHTTNYSMVLKS